MRMKKLILIAGLVMLFAAGCSGETNGGATANSSNDSSAIMLDGDSISCANETIQVEDSKALITKAGTYTISGTLDNGQITVNATEDGTITLVLDNANITCSDGAAINILEADNVIISLPDGSESIVTDGSSYSTDNATADIDAAIYSKADFTIEGSGTLTVNGNYNDGIASRDTLLIKGGNINVNAVNHGIKGRDYLVINGGNIVVDAGKDGIKATNDTQASFGYIEINGGDIDVTAGDEGISAISSATVNGGIVNIQASKAGIKSEGTIDLQGGIIDIQTSKEGLSCQSSIGSTAVQLTINGETVSLQ